MLLIMSVLFHRSALLAALKSGKTLVVDRYAYSGVAYSAAKAAPGGDDCWRCELVQFAQQSASAVVAHLTAQAAQLSLSAQGQSGPSDSRRATEYSC